MIRNRMKFFLKLSLIAAFMMPLLASAKSSSEGIYIQNLVTNADKNYVAAHWNSNSYDNISPGQKKHFGQKKGLVTVITGPVWTTSSKDKCYYYAGLYFDQTMTKNGINPTIVITNGIAVLYDGNGKKMNQSYATEFQCYAGSAPGYHQYNG